MVVFLLILSVLLVVLAVAMYRAPWLAIVSLLGVLAVVGYGILWFSTRSLMLVFPCLLATWIVCRWRDASRKRFAGFAAVSIAAGWLGAMLLFIPRWNEIQQLAVDYPVVRMDERLGYERQMHRHQPQAEDLSQSTQDQVRELEERYSRAEWNRPASERWKDRSRALRALEATHDDFVQAFVHQKGFGLERIAFNTPPLAELINIPEPAPLQMPRVDMTSVSAGEVREPRTLDAAPFAPFHTDQLLDFADQDSFGSTLDGGYDESGRHHVATQVRGFQPHAFSTIPTDSPAGDEWQLGRLELVSLLKHDPPAVYLSEHLPRMQELASDDAPTRPLNEFEARSLQRLRDGETIVAEESRNRIMMLGGLRAAWQCLQCHSVGEGHLLGAFSYEFLRKEPLPPENEQPKRDEPVT